jgi:hypothetical protein
MALGIIPGAPDFAGKAFTNLKADLDEEKAARLAAQTEVDVLSWAVRNMNIYADRFASQIPTIEDKVKHLENKVVDGLNKVRAWELCLEHTTRANDDYQKQIAELAKKLESRSFDRLWSILSFLNYFLANPLSYPVFMPKPSTHRMHDPGSIVPHIRPKVFTNNQMS